MNIGKYIFKEQFGFSYSTVHQIARISDRVTHQCNIDKALCLTRCH